MPDIHTNLFLALLCVVWNGMSFDSEATVARWTPASLSTDQYESSPTFTPDGREIFFMRSDRSFRQWRILHSRCRGGEWTEPVSPTFAAKAPAQDADPFVTPGGERIYFASTRHDPAREDLDIYFADRAPNGKWGNAQRLPEPVNSRASELLPRVDGSGTLYFGSHRPGGMGQGDIYEARLAPSGTWEVRNLGAPVNTSFAEYEADISLDGKTLVVVADRGERSHLYRFRREGDRGDRWIERERIPANDSVFQVGPLLSPKADRLLFAQSAGALSGEIFLIDLQPRPDDRWPPACVK